jgi:hypothetical protein
MHFTFNMWKQPWWSCFHTMHNIQSLLYLFFCFIDYKLYKFMWFLTIMNIMWELYALRTRGNKCENMLWIWQWFNKNVFKHKTRLQVDNKIKNIVNLCFYHVDCNFFWSSFWHEFFSLKHAHFFLLHYGLQSLKMLHNTWHSPHYVKRNDWKN